MGLGWVLGEMGGARGRVRVELDGEGRSCWDGGGAERCGASQKVERRRAQAMVGLASCHIIRRTVTQEDPRKAPVSTP